MRNATAALHFLWAGSLFGVAFLATPAKFLAPSLSLPVAVDVARWTFRAHAYVEWGVLAIAGILLVILLRRKEIGLVGLTALCLAAVFVSLACETLLLRPLLDVRVETIIQGGSVPESSLHTVYIINSGARLLLLCLGGGALLRR